VNEIEKLVGQTIMIMEDLGIVITFGRNATIQLGAKENIDEPKFMEVQQFLSEHPFEIKIFFNKLKWLRDAQEKLNKEGEKLLNDDKTFSTQYELKLDKWDNNEKYLRIIYDYENCIKGIDKDCHSTNTYRSIIKCAYCHKESEDRVDISNLISQLPDEIQELF
tara:strand:- start:1440 stop:1931 length:492 start_codon:yes stop_codon:yes gene_type:complete